MSTHKPVFGVSTRSNPNRAVQPQKMARGLKFRIQEVEGLYYQSSETKGAQISFAVTAKLICLCFHICNKQVFSQLGSYVIAMFPASIQYQKKWHLI